MHPQYKRTRRKTLFIGSFAIVVGVFGALMPIIPGTFLVLTGLSVLSLQSKLALRILVELRTRYPSLATAIKNAETWLTNFFHLTTHRREHYSIPSSTGGTISILAEPTEFIAGTVILLHSLSGIAETRVMNTLAEAFKIRGFSVVRFDASNALGDSSGDYTKFSTTSYRDDLTRVVEWTETQPWWQEPLILAGHSLGGLVAGLYASEHQAEVDGLILLAPSLSGESLEQAFLTSDRGAMEAWRTNGIKTIAHPISKEEFCLPYSFIKDMKQYSLKNHAHDLPMPVTIYSGSKDDISPTQELDEFCKTIGNHATLKILPGLGHTPRSRKDNEVLERELLKLCLLVSPIK